MMFYLFIVLSQGQGALQVVQVSPQAAALRLQPLPVEGELG